MTDEQRHQRITDLEKLFAARRDVPGYRKNLEAIQAEIDRLKADNGETQQVQA